MSKEEYVSLRDEIASAFASDNAKTDDISNEAVVDKLQERDESGRFAGKKDEPESKADEAADKPDVAKDPEVSKEPDTAESAGEGEGSATEVKLNESKAPSSWSPKVREKWAELPEEVRSEIIRREEASVNGVRKLQDEYAPIQRFVESISPFIQEASQLGQDPAGYISNVMAAERQLRNPDQEARFRALLNIADQYGIPLRQIINVSAGRELLRQPQVKELHPAVQQELESMRQWREKQEATRIETHINEFKAGKEFFDDVRDSMADLMDSGMATSLEDAYEKACRLNPEVFQVITDRKRAETGGEELKKRQAAAAGASVKSSGQADVQVETDDEDSIGDTVRKAMREASGRV